MVPAKGNILNLVGRRYGRLTVVSFHDMEKSRARWLCNCECGNVVVARSGALQRGSKQSCGCLLPYVNGVLNRTHGQGHPKARTSEYRTWEGLQQRCCNPSYHSFANYGGRGITVCDRWRNGEGGIGPFECFIADMGMKPSALHSIDRVDVDGHYSPENCRWATPKQQSRNRRDCHYVECAGRRMALIEACEVSGVKYTLVQQRIARGETFSEAISRPSRSSL